MLKNTVDSRCGLIWLGKAYLIVNAMVVPATLTGSIVIDKDAVASYNRYRYTNEEEKESSLTSPDTSGTKNWLAS